MTDQIVNYEMAYLGACAEIDELEQMLKRAEADFRKLKELVICDFHGTSGQLALMIIENRLNMFAPRQRAALRDS